MISKNPPLQKLKIEFAETKIFMNHCDIHFDEVNKKRRRFFCLCVKPHVVLGFISFAGTLIFTRTYPCFDRSDMAMAYYGDLELEGHPSHNFSDFKTVHGMFTCSLINKSKSTFATQITHFI